MEIKETVRKLFCDFVENTFQRDIRELKVYIYGVELQICGGILKYIEDMDVTLISYDLRNVCNSYEGRECRLPEECMPYTDNAVVLCSILYEYQYREYAVRLEKSCGISAANIAWARPVAEKIMISSADYFAQGKMDLKVREYFDRIGKDISRVRYLDIGANNFCLYNNTYLFYRAGARGVLVEANPDFCDILQKNRPGDRVLMCGCTDRQGDTESVYYQTDRAGYNTFVKSVADHYEARGIHILNEIRVPMRFVNDILNEYFPDGHVDYLSVDIEGMGCDVLLAVDYEKYDIDILLIEMDFLEEKSVELFRKLCGMGYQAVYKGIGGSKDFLFYRKAVFE